MGFKIKVGFFFYLPFTLRLSISFFPHTNLSLFELPQSLLWLHVQMMHLSMQVSYRIHNKLAINKIAPHYYLGALEQSWLSTY